jgi:CRP-like cAMP-binding protein
MTLDHYQIELRDSILKIHPLPKNKMGLLLDKVSIKKIKKGELFLKRNEIATQLGFLIQGALLVKTLEENGNELVVHFNIPSKTPFVGAMSSLAHNDYSNTEITALEDSYLGVINYQELLKLYERHHVLETLGRKILERQYLSAIEDARFRHGKTTNEKFKLFKEQYPEVQNLCMERDIANFLGVKSSYFSRFKKKLLMN